MTKCARRQRSSLKIFKDIGIQTRNGIEPIFMSVKDVWFDFGPTELNRYCYVRQRVYAEGEKCGFAGLIYKSFFKLFHHKKLKTEDVCLELFDSLQKEISNEDREKSIDGQVMVYFIEEEMLQEGALEEMKSFLSGFPSRKKFLVLKSGINLSDVDAHALQKFNSVFIRCDCESMKPIYDELYLELEERLDLLIGNPQQTNREELKRLRDILTSRNMQNSISLATDCEEFLSREMKQGIVGYRIDDTTLTIYVEDKMKNERNVDNKIKKIKKKWSEAEIRTCFVKPPFVKPHGTLKAGKCFHSNRTSFSGTLGMFANLLSPGRPSKSMRQIGITSPHVIWKGQTASVEINNRTTELGKCIWPEGTDEGQDAINANMSDIAVIDISENFDCQNFQYPVFLYDGAKSLERRKVFKYGASTALTEGTISESKLVLLGTEVMLIESEKGKFSEEGDSGAIVLTEQGRKLLAIGVVVGSEINLRNSDKRFPKNTIIAVSLEKAIKKFNNVSEDGTIVIAEK